MLVSQGQTATTYDPAGLLEFSQTYYWRVDFVGRRPCIPPSTKGRSWSFTTEAYAYPIKNVTATASSCTGRHGAGEDGRRLGARQERRAFDGWQRTCGSAPGAQPNWIQYQFDKVYTLHELWVWNSNQPVEPFIGFGAKTVKIEYSTDGTTWTPLANVPEFARAPGQPGYAANTTVSFGGVTAKYVKLTIEKNWGGTPADRPERGAVLLRSGPGPSAAAGHRRHGRQSVDATLNWRPGREAASHKVYFGTDRHAVANGTAAAKTVTDHSFDPGRSELRHDLLLEGR